MRGQVILVDTEDREQGAAEKMLAHEQGLLHRAFSVLLYREREGAIEFLLQQRHANKYHTGGLWTNTCCSHPQPGETTAAAAEARLREETGIKTALLPIGQFRYFASFANGLIEHELDHVFIGCWDEMPTAYDPEEIDAMAWITFKSLRQALADFPERYTPWLVKVLELTEAHLKATPPLPQDE
jgi:isopentenyl-diphosphate delta-isomerase